MPLLPNQVKFRKQHTRGFNPKHIATRGNKVSFGDYGLQAIEGGEITSRQIESARVAASHHMGRQGKMWIRVFPHTPVTGRPAETRMGKGKGAVDYWCAKVKPGTVLFELAGVTEDIAREAMRRQTHKLPIRMRLIKREGL
ncbi:MAG: 50S ribosomal protein L16 [Planctomycetota bacterium]